MTKAVSARIDFQLLPSGQAGASLVLLGEKEEVTHIPSGASIIGHSSLSPRWVPSDPAIVISPAPDGMSALVSLASPPVPAKDITISVGPFMIQNTDGTDDTIPVSVSKPIEIIQGGPKGPALKIVLMPDPPKTPEPAPEPATPATAGTPLVPPSIDQNKPLIPKISNLAARPPVIQKGQSAMLDWSVDNSTDVSINPEFGAVGSNGSKPVSPASTTTYVLTAKSPSGVDTRSVTVTVQ